MALLPRREPTQTWYQARWGTRRRFTWRRLWAGVTPARLFVGSFGTLVLLGTAGFRWLPGLYTGEPLSWVDALFMATSAVCVTGLVVVSPATDFTILGQLWTLVLIQLGGLGLLTLTSGVLLTVGRRLSLRHEQLVRSTTEAQPQVDYRVLIRQVIRFTFAIEFAGFVMLYIAWVPRFGIGGAFWPAVFHAVSAFCNAGFSIFADSMMGHAGDGFTLTAVMLLVVLGGIGFLTLSELSRRFQRGGDRQRLSLHTQLVFSATLIALVVGAFTFGFFEWEHTLGGMSRADRIANSLFGSVTARTAGFNTVDYGTVRAPTGFATIILMFIGGAPGSTAGGVKITTIALLLLLAYTRLRGRHNVSAHHRTIPDETLGRAIGLAVISVMVLMAALFMLLAVDTRAAEPQLFLPYMFEAVSAFGTVGLSMGVTPQLSDPARLVIIVLMFSGRVGVLTLAAALSLERRALPFRYAKEDVAIG